MRETLDIHGLLEVEAKNVIERTIKALPKEVTELVVIHGYRNGDALKNLVQSPHKLRSKRIVRRRYTMNKGETILVIKP